MWVENRTDGGLVGEDLVDGGGRENVLVAEEATSLYTKPRWHVQGALITGAVLEASGSTDKFIETVTKTAKQNHRKRRCLQKQWRRTGPLGRLIVSRGCR